MPRSSGPLAAPPKSHARLRAGHLMRAIHVASLVGPGLAPVVGVITPQLKTGSTRNRAGESGRKRISRRKRTQNYRELQRLSRKIPTTTPVLRAAPSTAARDSGILRSQVLGGRVVPAISAKTASDLTLRIHASDPCFGSKLRIHASDPRCGSTIRIHAADRCFGSTIRIRVCLQAYRKCPPISCAFRRWTRVHPRPTPT